MIRLFFISCFLFLGTGLLAQEEGDTVYKRCPLYITDTLTANNFFIEGLPATIKVYKVSGDLTIAIQQKEQFFTMFFKDRKLKTGKYKIAVNPGGREIAAKYSFRSGGQVSYVNVSNDTLESVFDKEKNLWHLKLHGMIANLVERSVTWYRVRADFYVK